MKMVGYTGLTFSLNKVLDGLKLKTLGSDVLTHFHTFSCNKDL